MRELKRHGDPAPRPKVSVCVVTYNQRDYIGRCLESIVTQCAGFEFEIIVGDDASTDGTTDIVLSYARRYPNVIRPQVQPVNIGPFDNYRAVHNCARGEYIAHVDGDDYWLQGKLATQVTFLAENPECAAVFCNAFVLTGDDITGLFNSPLPAILQKTHLICQGNILNHSSMMYRNSHKAAIGALDGPFIDYRIYANLIQRGPFGFINDPLVVYRSNAKNAMTRSSPDRVLNLYWDVLIAFQSCEKNAARRGMAYFWRSVVLSCLASGHIDVLCRWHRRVISALGWSALPVFLGGYLYAVRHVLNRFWHGVCRSFGGNRLRVLH